MQKIPYTYAINFDSSIAGSGASDTKEVTIDTGSDFVVEEIDVVAWLPTTQSSMIAFSEISQDSSPTAASNTGPQLSSLRAQIETSDNKWSNTPLRASSIVRRRGSNLLLTQPLVPAGQKLKATLYNDGSFTVQAQIVFRGYKLKQ